MLFIPFQQELAFGEFSSPARTLMASRGTMNSSGQLQRQQVVLPRPRSAFFHLSIYICNLFYVFLIYWFYLFLLIGFLFVFLLDTLDQYLF